MKVYNGTRTKIVEYRCPECSWSGFGRELEYAFATHHKSFYTCFRCPKCKHNFEVDIEKMFTERWDCTSSETDIEYL